MSGTQETKKSCTPSCECLKSEKGCVCTDAAGTSCQCTNCSC